MKKIQFIFHKDVQELGVKVITAQISPVSVSHFNNDFEQFKSAELEKIKSTWVRKDFKKDTVLEGFRILHTKVGRSNRDYIASPEALRGLLIEKNKFPKINILVDTYNLISLKTGLALGAHDVDKIIGNVTLRFTKGNETFIPLGKTEPLNTFPGEYSYIDDGNNIICRLEVLQVEPTKITANTNNVFLIIQGNENTTAEYVKSTADEVCSLITKYCGGSFCYLNDLS